MSFLHPRLAKVLSASSITALVVVLVFRFAVYRHMYIAPGDPYGISDIVELLLGLGLMCVLGISLIAAIALAVRGPKENRIAAGWLLGVCVLVAVVVEPLHTLAAKWAL
ncbi:MAG: hypothetical protein A2Z90_11115 [Burkholderiales bacterium GWA2_64_37]|nr:MAG: hypothetical protein A2Z90_11115 [Burkholderiales bacterium GWA2_64_37]HCE94344.1 hypothetical protein [Acidovorax sp.]